MAWLAAFVAAMAYLESAVVAYLRELYYPQGFRFPIAVMLDRLTAIEVGREAATIVMLLAVAALAGSDRWERSLLFCVAFGVWDILYYVWLWIFTVWPPSFLTLDLLFLIPVPWIGPVLAPILVAVMLVAGPATLLHLKIRGAALRFPRHLWVLAVSGVAVVILAFTIDCKVVLQGRPPRAFRWGLFGTGLAMTGAAFGLGIHRQLRLLEQG